MHKIMAYMQCGYQTVLKLATRIAIEELMQTAGDINDSQLH